LKLNSDLTWPQWPKFGINEHKAVKRVIESNQLFAEKEVKTFEEQYSAYLGTKHCLGLGNATQALHLALAALDIGEGDEVLVTSYSWISTASCILMQNAVPVFCDIEKESLGLCPQDLETKITPLTKAVIITHMFGYPSKIQEIQNICIRYGIPLIEDSSHAHGAEVDDKKVGTFGDISVFSLHQRKSLSVGDGGLLCTNHDKVAEKVFRLRSFGHEELSYNYRMTEFAGALGKCALNKLDEQNKIRRDNAHYLSEQLQTNEKIKVKLSRKNEKGVYYAVLLEVLETWQHSDQEIDKLKNAGVPIRETWTPLHLHPHFNPHIKPARGLPWKNPNYKGSMENVSYKELNLPVAKYYCPKRILEFYVHPPCSFKHMDCFLEHLSAKQ